MARSLTPATLGSLVRETRMAAGVSQTALGARIGASRFWVAQFEKGKPSAELGLALKALAALGLVLRLDAPTNMAPTQPAPSATERDANSGLIPRVDLNALIAAAVSVRDGKRSR